MGKRPWPLGKALEKLYYSGFRLGDGDGRSTGFWSIFFRGMSAMIPVSAATLREEPLSLKCWLLAPVVPCALRCVSLGILEIKLKTTDDGGLGHNSDSAYFHNQPRPAMFRALRICLKFKKSISGLIGDLPKPRRNSRENVARILNTAE